MKVLSKTEIVFLENLRTLMSAYDMNNGQLAKKSKVPIRSIQALQGETRGASVIMIERLAAAFGMEPYQMLIPNVDPRLATSGRLSKLINNYMTSDEDDCLSLDREAARSAKLAALENGPSLNIETPTTKKRIKST